MFASTISLYQENYGKSDPQCVAAVKNVYKELDLQVQLLLLQQLEVEYWSYYLQQRPSEPVLSELILLLH